MKQYQDLLRAILSNGSLKPAARENMPGTLSLFGYQMRFNLSEGFPIVTTKHTNFDMIVTELLWFLNGDTNIKYLVDNGCNIWNEDAYNYYRKVCRGLDYKTPLGFQAFIDNIKDGPVDRRETFPGYRLGDCGHQYGKTWRNFNGVDQIKSVLNSLRDQPESRRHIVTAVDPANDHNLALYWCHSFFQFNCRPIPYLKREAMYLDLYPEAELVDNEIPFGIPKYYLDCHFYQRSADSFLGVPFNIASYALLTELIARVVGMVPGELIHSFGDVHIYENHLEGVKELLSREPKELPKLVISSNAFTDLEVRVNAKYAEVISSDLRGLNREWIWLEDYDYHPRIKGKLSTGLK